MILVLFDFFKLLLAVFIISFEKSVPIISFASGKYSNSFSPPPVPKSKIYEYENFIAYEIGFDLNDVAADTSKLVMLNALYLKLREEVITQRQKDRSIQFGVW